MQSSHITNSGYDEHWDDWGHGAMGPACLGELSMLLPELSEEAVPMIWAWVCHAMQSSHTSDFAAPNRSCA